jgi:hypothetical protein
LYPANVFALFPPFPREEKVFVAMSFDHAFDQRWREVIEPAIQAADMEAHRVDTRKVGDSILTEIVSGIGKDRLVFADITALGRLPGGYVVRNGNVMYEVGIAHAARLPEEVLLFRSDSEQLSFDLMHVRVNSYDPDNRAEEARRAVVEAITDTLREIDLTRHLAVRAGAESLDESAVQYLSAAEVGPITNPRWARTRTASEDIRRDGAISRLLQAVMLTSFYPDLLSFKTSDEIDELDDTVGLFEYQITKFGQAVISYVRWRFTGIEPPPG